MNAKLHIIIPFFIHRYNDDLLVFYLNNYIFLDLAVSYPAYHNLSENCLNSNVINFLDLKNILNSSRLLNIEVYGKH